MANSSKDFVLFWTLIALAFVGNHHNVFAEKNETSGMSKIANGREAAHRPYQIQLFYNGRFHCSGSIIDSRWVLTAAHCIHRTNPQLLQIIAGSQIRAKYAGPEYIFSVVVAIPHQAYNYQENKHDIALLKVDKPFRFSKNQVWPIALNTKAMPMGQMLRVAGWGRDEHEQLSRNSKETTVQVVPLTSCSTNLWNTQICAAPTYERGLDCGGDSGGPVTDVYQKSVVGIVSYGYGIKCPSTLPSVYTNVASYQNWIVTMINYYQQY